VTLIAECGASTGTVCDWTSGPGPLGEYHFTADWHDRIEGATSAGPGQIAELIEPAPPAAAFQIGQQVVLGTRSGTVIGLPGGDLVDVDVLVEMTRWRGKSYCGKTNFIAPTVAPRGC
jgi:hypothetical protein